MKLATRDFHVSTRSPDGVQIFGFWWVYFFGFCVFVLYHCISVFVFRSWQNILSRLAAMSNMPEWKFDLPRPSCQTYHMICLRCQNIDDSFRFAHKAREDTSSRWKDFLFCRTIRILKRWRSHFLLLKHGVVRLIAAVAGVSAYGHVSFWGVLLKRPLNVSF